MTSNSNPLCSNPGNTYSSLIQALLNPTNDSSSVPTPDETAANIVATVTASSSPVDDLAHLWGKFFDTVVTSDSSSYAPHFALLNALCAHPPTRPENVSTPDAREHLQRYTEPDGQLHWSSLPRFSLDWIDQYSNLENCRAFGRSTAGGPTSRNFTKFYLRFCSFSAAWVKATNGKRGIYPMQVFYTCRNVLECKDSRPQAPYFEANKLTAEQLWDVDVRAAAIWLRDGGPALWQLCETEHFFLRQEFARTLDWETELWPAGKGLIPERWQLWEERLRSLGVHDEWLNEETKAVAIEAADVVKGLLEGTN